MTTPSNLLAERRNRLAWFALLAGLIPALLVWYSLHVQDEHNGRVQFDLQVGEIVGAIDKRLHQHQQILLGGAGLFDASETITRSEWRTYIERLQLADNYPGIQGVGFTQFIAPAALDAHIAGVRREGFSDYTVRPAGARERYTSIVFLEPFSGRNLAAFGFDMFSETVRREAMTRAAESGKTAISGKVKLVQETHGKPQAGFLMYVPVYRKGFSLDSPSARWQALLGFVYSPYRVEDLLQGILGERNHAIDFSIHDGSTGSDDALLYSSADSAHTEMSPLFVAERRIEAYGRDWIIRLSTREAFKKQFRSGFETVVLMLGGGVSLLLFALTWSLVGRREKAVALAHEMTLQIRENQNRLAEVNTRFELATNSAGIGVWDYDLASDTLIWDAQMYQLYGVTPDEVDINYAFWVQCLHPDDRAHVEAGLRAATLSGTEFDASFRITHKDGTLHHIKAFAQMKQMKSTDSRDDRRIIGVNYDITQRVAAESALREGALYTEAIINNVLDGIITIDEQGIVDTYSTGAERIFGYNEREVRGRNVNMLMPEPYHSQHDGYLQSYMRTGVARIIGIGREVTGQRNNGAHFPMELSVSEISHMGQRMFVGLIRDITERKQAERMKNEFVSTVSHELRTPLTSISGALGLLAAGVAGTLPADAQPLVDIALKNSQRLNLLINDLLDMEKIAAGMMQFVMETQLLMPLIEQALQSNQAYGDQFQVRFVITARDESVSVHVDAQRLMQVLSNFLSNAAKFSPQQSTVDISVSRHGEHVRVAVRDHGAGVPESFRSRIFEKFSQADSSDTRQKGGTGLGLAITRELLSRMGGSAGFESIEGQGATFYFDLPIRTPTSTIAGDAAAAYRSP